MIFFLKKELNKNRQRPHEVKAHSHGAVLSECDHVSNGLSMRLFIWCDCDIAVTLVCAMSHMEQVSYTFCAIVMCDSNMFL